MSIYQFTFHDGVANKPPYCKMSELYYKCNKEGCNILTAKERQEIVDQLKGKTVYQYIGWAFDFEEYLSRFLVRTYETDWQEVYAFNKQNIRKNIYLRTGIKEIHEIPKK